MKETEHAGFLVEAFTCECRFCLGCSRRLLTTERFELRPQLHLARCDTWVWRTTHWNMLDDNLVEYGALSQLQSEL